MNMPGHKDSSKIEGEMKSQNRKVTSKEVPEHITLEDSKPGQTGRSRYEEEVENQLTKEKSDVSPKDLLKKMSKKKLINN
jgi:hypothetical protein